MSEVSSSSSMRTASDGMGDGARQSQLGHALSQSIEIKEKIAGVGDELLVNNAVLKQEIPETLQTGEVAQALEKNGALEAAVQECADDLAEVSVALEEEVAQRQRLERQLAESQAALAKGQNRAQGPTAGAG